jgi:hypothetical protein
MTLTEKNLRTADRYVRQYARKRNWPAVARLIGGSPREDLLDWTPADAGEPPAGAQW